MLEKLAYTGNAADCSAAVPLRNDNVGSWEMHRSFVVLSSLCEDKLPQDDRCDFIAECSDTRGRAALSGPRFVLHGDLRGAEASALPRHGNTLIPTGLNPNFLNSLVVMFSVVSLR
jgi:hypothetical protein